MGVLLELDEIQDGVAHRPSRLYRFDRTAYRKFVNDGYLFEI